ncbi:hypothetical protein HDU98_000596 [Podochytrium sp. JEL0797]|nr:hypothetical protein HDU98_000596 [Podochytrium sp. JEL0797]
MAFPATPAPASTDMIYYELKALRAEQQLFQCEVRAFMAAHAANANAAAPSNAVPPNHAAPAAAPAALPALPEPPSAPVPASSEPPASAPASKKRKASSAPPVKPAATKKPAATSTPAKPNPVPAPATPADADASDTPQPTTEDESAVVEKKETRGRKRKNLQDASSSSSSAVAPTPPPVQQQQQEPLAAVVTPQQEQHDDSETNIIDVGSPIATITTVTTTAAAPVVTEKPKSRSHARKVSVKDTAPPQAPSLAAAPAAEEENHTTHASEKPAISLPVVTTSDAESGGVESDGGSEDLVRVPNDAASGWWFNLKYADEVEAYSKAYKAWYLAKVLYYIALPNQIYRLKIHYVGYAKEFDEEFEISAKLGRSRLRPHRKENKKLEEVRAEETVPEEQWDLSHAKPYGLMPSMKNEGGLFIQKKR